MADRCFYFGCWNEAGHYLHARGGRSVMGEERKKVELFGNNLRLDGTLAPLRAARDGSLCWRGQGKDVRERDYIEARSGECRQGLYLLHHLDNGFSAVQWWDRTQGDTRPGCNSTILLEGMHTAEEVLAAGRENFPHVFENLAKAGVELVEAKP